MQLIRSYKYFPKDLETSVCLGNFDGVHLGHSEIIKEASGSMSSVVYSFHPHPREIFEKKRLFKLTSFRQKYNIIKNLGADYFIYEHFNEPFRQMDAESFFYRVLVSNLNTRRIVVGHDFIFGKGRGGNAAFLKEHCAKNNIEFIQVKAKVSGNEAISSSRIRNYLREGNVIVASKLLGRNYIIEGKVIKGRQLARQLGYKTANILLPSSNEIKRGVYRAKVFGRDAVVNVGIKPTITDENKLVLEAHILDFNEDIYGKRISVELLDFIREEKKFDNFDELKVQIEKDVKKYKYALISAIIVLVIDQVQKNIMVADFCGDRFSYLPNCHGLINEVSSFFSLVMVWNFGMSFGMFQGAYSIYIISAIGLMIIGFLIWWLTKVDKIIIATAIGFIVGGALGNIIDRFNFGAVADFFDFYVQVGNKQYHYPAFNIADSFIFIGAVIIIIDSITSSRGAERRGDPSQD